MLRAETRSVDVAVLRLTGRLVRRGAGLLALAAVALTAVEALSYRVAYPDPASRTRLAALQDNAALRTLEGVPHRVETVGGFVVWDVGWLVALVLAVWAALTAVRLLRGDEDEGRAELVQVAPVGPGRVLALQLGLVVVGAALAGVATAVTIALCGGAPVGAVAFGAGLTGLAGTFAAAAAVSAQLVVVRRRAAAAATAVLGLGFLLRMAANTREGLGSLRWLTPFGWLDALQPYGDPRWGALLPLLLAPVALAALAVRLRQHRDLGAGHLRGLEHHGAHLRLLGSPLALAWRETRGVLLAWAVGVGAYALLIGALLTTVTDLVATDPGYRRVLASLGLDVARLRDSYLGMMAVLLGLVVSLYACWRLGAAAAEERSGRLDQVLARPVARWRWLGGHLLLTLAGTAALSLTCAAGFWVGSVASGARLGVGAALAAAANPLPAVVAVTGLAAVTLALAPRLTTTGPASIAVLSLVVDLLGQSLRWPAAVLDLSAFHHLAYVPAEPVAVLPALVLSGLGALAMLTALVAFGRRDVSAG